MATANSTAQTTGETDSQNDLTPYTAPKASDRPALFTLLQAVGSLAKVGRSSEADGLRPIWNTDPESLQHLEVHAEGALLAITDGISGIGMLLYHAALSEELGTIPAEALRGVGLLLHELSEAAYPLHELEHLFREGKAQTVARARKA